MTLAAVLSCATLFTSCNKDNPDQPVGPDKTPVAAVIEYSLGVSDDLLNAFDLTVDYYDAAGAVKSEPMTSKTWTKTVKSNQLPATLGARVNIKLKSGFDPSKEGVFSAKHQLGYEYHCINKSGEDVGKGGLSTVTGGSDMKYDKVPDYAERYKDKPIMKSLFNFAADGTATSGSWE